MSKLSFGLLSLASFLGLSYVECGDYPGGFRPAHIHERLKRKDIFTGATAKPSAVKSLAELPKELDWCNYTDGKSYCAASWNQHIPQYCGSCYVHGSLHAANDRIKIMMGGFNDVLLARQVILNCGPKYGLGNGCGGGEAYDIFEYMHRYGLPDESCQNYVAKSLKCNTETICQNCMPVDNPNDPDDISVTKCWSVPRPILYYATEYGSLEGEEAMMSEIQAGGPITCGFASTEDFDYNYKGGIYYDQTNATRINHDVEVVGWGEENGIKYWKARNSWGTYWGQNSFFKIVRGVNNMQFESQCVFARFDTKPVQKVLKGDFIGSMYGLIDTHNDQPAPVKLMEENNDAQDKLNQIFQASDQDQIQNLAPISLFEKNPAPQQPRKDDNNNDKINDESADSEGPVSHSDNNNHKSDKENKYSESFGHGAAKGRSHGKGNGKGIPDIDELRDFLKKKGIDLDNPKSHGHNKNPAHTSLFDSTMLAEPPKPDNGEANTPDASETENNAKWRDLVNEYKDLVGKYAEAYKNAYAQGKADAQANWKQTKQNGSDEALAVGQKIHDLTKEYTDEHGLPFIGKPNDKASASASSDSTENKNGAVTPGSVANPVPAASTNLNEKKSYSTSNENPNKSPADYQKYLGEYVTKYADRYEKLASQSADNKYAKQGKDEASKYSDYSKKPISGARASADNYQEQAEEAAARGGGAGHPVKLAESNTVQLEGNNFPYAFLFFGFIIFIAAIVAFLKLKFSAKRTGYDTI